MGSSRVIRHQASNYAQSAYQCHIKEPLLSLFGNEKQHSSGTTAAAAITFPQKLIIDQLTRKRKTKKKIRKLGLHTSVFFFLRIVCMSSAASVFTGIRCVFMFRTNAK
ncbi:hypothetical protein FOB22_006284 [Saccharomyces cerevisiae]|nr:hypothetical protein FOB22_006284 [Saccharomyces cerevisiae]